MSDPQKTVFISYRRDTSKYLARSIFMELRSHDYDVFLDVNTIDSGAFDSIILHQIAARAHFILLLSPGAFERCTQVDDWLRKEIEEAIRLQRNIVPIVEEGVNLEQEMGYLPAALSEKLSRYNRIPLIPFYFDAAMDALRNRFLKLPVYAVVAPTLPVESAEVEKRIEQAATQAMTAQEYFERGDAAWRSGNVESAIADCADAIRLKPDYVEAYSRRGTALAQKGDLDSAIADYTEAIRLNPAYFNAFYNRGMARHSKNDLDGALADFTEAIQLDPENADGYVHRGIVHKEMRNVDLAIADYDAAIQLDPQYADAYFNRAIAYQVKGKTNHAVTDYTEAIRLKPDDLDAYKLRGVALQLRGDLGSAIADYQRYLDLGGSQNPDHTHIENWIVDLKKTLGKRR